LLDFLTFFNSATERMYRALPPCPLQLGANSGANFLWCYRHAMPPTRIADLAEKILDRKRIYAAAYAADT
jgi:hypothetical protein